MSTLLPVMGSPEKVAEATKEVIEKTGANGFLLASGACILPGVCPPENVQAMVDTAGTFGR